MSLSGWGCMGLRRVLNMRIGRSLIKICLIICYYLYYHYNAIQHNHYKNLKEEMREEPVAESFIFPETSHARAFLHDSAVPQARLGLVLFFHLCHGVLAPWICHSSLSLDHVESPSYVHLDPCPPFLNQHSHIRVCFQDP